MHLADNARAAMPTGGTLRISTAPRRWHRPNPTAPPPTPASSSPSPIPVSAWTNQPCRASSNPSSPPKTPPSPPASDSPPSTASSTRARDASSANPAPGRGTTFRIFLPIAADSTGRRARAQRMPHPARRRRSARQQAPRSRAQRSRLLRPFRLRRRRSPGRLRHPALRNRRHRHRHAQARRRRTNPAPPPARPNLPVVLISGYSEQLSVLENLPSNQIAFLQKPFASPTLIAVLRNLLSSAAPEPPSTNR